MFARGRSKNAPTDNKNLTAESKEITPTDSQGLSGIVVLFDKLEFVTLFAAVFMYIIRLVKCSAIYG